MKRLFAYYERQIRFFNCYEWEQGKSKETLIQKRDALLAVVKNIGNKDLMVLYYLRSIKGISVERLLRLLQNLYKAEQELYGDLQEKERGVDLMQIYPRKYKNSSSV